MATSPCMNHEDRFPPYLCTVANGLPVDCKTPSLESHTSEVKAVLKPLEAKSSQPQSWMNARYDVLTSKLPVEVVSHIFVKFMEDSDQQSPQSMSLEWGHVNLPKYANHWIPSINGRHGGPFRVREPLQLGSICNAWRAIAWSTPQLWTTIAVDVGRRDLDFIDQLVGCLARSRSLPLHILISNNTERQANLHLNPHVIRIVDELLAHSRRWVSLHIRGLPQNVAQYICCDDGARPKLEDLHLFMRNSTTKKLTINAAWDRLTRITTCGIHFSQIDIDWSNLTHVSVSLRIGECFEVLALARRLTKFGVHWAQDGGPNVFRNEVAIQHDALRHLELYNVSSPAAAEISQHAAFPALESYRYEVQDFSQLGRLGFQQVMGNTFRLRSGQSLKHLTIREYNNKATPCSDLIIVLQGLPALEYLDLNILHDHSYFDPFFNMLSISESTPNSGAAAENFLPNLKELCLKNWRGISWTLVPQIFGPSIATHISNSDNIQARPVKLAPHQRPLRLLEVSGMALDEYINCDVVLQFMSLMDQGIVFHLRDVKEVDTLDASIRFHRLAR